MTPPLTLRRILTLGIFSSNPSKCCQKLKRNNWIFPPSVSQNTKWQCVNWQAYKNHWVLRTKPDDWFFPVIRRIAQVVDDNALHPEVMAYLGRGKPKSELRVNFNKGFEKMFEELSLQISRNLVTSEYAKVNRVGQGMSTFPLKHRTQTLYLLFTWFTTTFKGFCQKSYFWQFSLFNVPSIWGLSVCNIFWFQFFLD